LRDVDWSEQWKQAIGVQRLGGLTVAPPWLADDSIRATVVIDPGMAFGTGEHATTRGVIRSCRASFAPAIVVADLGAGSAVLAIAASNSARLASPPSSSIPTRSATPTENVARNGVEIVSP
jgi:ribosomal protein L11 methyltransferase